MRFFFVALFAFLVNTATAHAQLNVCNKGPSPILVAIAFDTAEQPISMGWTRIEGKSCAEALSKELDQPFYYYYAYDEKAALEWTGPYRFCVSNQKEFSIRGAADCEARNYRTIGFTQFETGNYKKFTFNIIGTPEQDERVDQKTVTISPSAESIQNAVIKELTNDNANAESSLDSVERKVIIPSTPSKPMAPTAPQVPGPSMDAPAPNTGTTAPNPATP